MKKSAAAILAIIIVLYLLTGLGIDRYNEYQTSKNETLIEGIARENDRYSPGHLLRIILWPLYLPE